MRPKRKRCTQAPSGDLIFFFQISVTFSYSHHPFQSECCGDIRVFHVKRKGWSEWSGVFCEKIGNSKSTNPQKDISVEKKWLSKGVPSLLGILVTSSAVLTILDQVWALSRRLYNNQFRFWAAHKANLVQCQGFFGAVNSDMRPQTEWSTKEKALFSCIVLYAITLVWSVSFRVLALETFLMTFFKLFHQPMRSFYLMLVSSLNKTNPTTR